MTVRSERHRSRAVLSFTMDGRGRNDDRAPQVQAHPTLPNRDVEARAVRPCSRRVHAHALAVRTAHPHQHTGTLSLFPPGILNAKDALRRDGHPFAELSQKRPPRAPHGSKVPHVEIRKGFWQEREAMRLSIQRAEREMRGTMTFASTVTAAATMAAMAAANTAAAAVTPTVVVVVVVVVVFIVVVFVSFFVYMCFCCVFTLLFLQYRV